MLTHPMHYRIGSFYILLIRIQKELRAILFISGYASYILMFLLHSIETAIEKAVNHENKR